MHPASRRLHLRAFTLIELLTVIAIIGILAAIIIPVVGKVRLTAKQSRSLSNVKQIVQGVLTYANENRGYLPQQSASGSNFTAPLWPQIVSVYLSGMPRPTNTGGWNAVKIHPVFSDPLLDDADHSGLSDYGNNTVVITTPLSAQNLPLGAFNIASAKSPSRLVVVGSAQELSGGKFIGCWYLNDYYWQNGPSNYGAISGRNGGPAMLGFLDGSVRAVPMTALDTREKRQALFANN